MFLMSHQRRGRGCVWNVISDQFLLYCKKINIDEDDLDYGKSERLTNEAFLGAHINGAKPIKPFVIVVYDTMIDDCTNATLQILFDCGLQQFIVKMANKALHERNLATVNTILILKSTTH